MKNLIFFIAFNAVTSIVYAQGLDMSAYFRGQDEAREANSREQEMRREQQQHEMRLEQQQQERLRQQAQQAAETNTINLLIEKFNKTHDYRYLFLLSKRGVQRASQILIEEGVFCSEASGTLICNPAKRKARK